MEVEVYFMKALRGTCIIGLCEVSELTVTSSKEMRDTSSLVIPWTGRHVTAG